MNAVYCGVLEWLWEWKVCTGMEHPWPKVILVTSSTCSRGGLGSEIILAWIQWYNGWLIEAMLCYRWIIVGLRASGSPSCTREMGSGEYSAWLVRQCQMVHGCWHCSRRQCVYILYVVLLVNGGYACLSGLSFTPDLYKCGIDIAGVSRIQWYQDTSWQYTNTLRAFATDNVTVTPHCKRWRGQESQP